MHNDDMDRKDLFDVVSVRGADALPFLHSQFAADLHPLGDGQLRWSALLNPQGRVLFVVAAIRVAADDWRLLVPFSRGSELVEALRRFVFRRKVLLSNESAIHATLGDAGWDSGIAGGALALTEQAADACTDAALDRFVAAGLALIDATASGRHLAHALRLDRFDAFSVKKGCYPGQEIVARTHFLGRNKRVPVLLEAGGNADWRSGDVLHDGDGDVGEIVCAGRTLALAVLTHAAAADHPLTVGADRRPARVARSFAPES
jgi:folate-binding protein YgfZ